MLEDNEENDDVSSLEAMEVEVPVGVRERPTTSHAISASSSQHCGSRNPVQIVPANNTILRRSTSFESLVEEEEEEEEVHVRTRPTTFRSSRHEENPPLHKSVHQIGGSQTQQQLSPTHTTQTDDQTNGTSNNVAGTSTSNQRSDDDCDKTQHAASPNGIDKWDTKDDLHIWQDMRAKIYQKNLIELISPQRPGPLGYLDRVSASMVNKQDNLSDADFGYRIHFADLQRIHIQYLHSKLVNLAVSAHFNGDDWRPGGKAEEIGKVLKEYIQAVRDHEYMGKYARTSNDPFIATSQRLYDKKFLEAAMTRNGYKMPEDFLPPPRQQYEQQLPQHEAPIPLIERLKRHSVPTGPWERDNTDKPARTLISTRTKAWKRAYWTRIGAALIGGTFLIAPMWILALQRNLFVHLGVATACIAAFGISISLYLETVDGVFAATLAYAAVIMVFVGIVIQETG
ncbi:hypothetical protein GE21DRAFT_10610 [Neurospora crassa]|uniref:DUF6594 domain-containing protein n=1 Tax=Neurospora crassa (strain ATCC 24698 / 74-OR23-1A / CBS 708.71 / DSM 1257 / FGSC 987) TaxID=367110 RepID=Q7S4A5_NEUCR|nr:hypothetical protein NCU08188 [Neurospora crassa OR74A]EAA30345.2 hypothetical protein NCU08188 [Neurospora crassa OR74A]KHE80426.1 hypothetical protein GE21DRAFT_10610 [Neurospora crassa]|eukprot:XP_959581.2 hypothetical protein NCU08188 [Neurospora crassa OR74A]